MRLTFLMRGRGPARSLRFWAVWEGTKTTQKKTRKGGVRRLLCLGRRQARSRRAPPREKPERRWAQRRALTANPRPCRRRETSPAESVIAVARPLGIGVFLWQRAQCARMLHFRTASRSTGLRADEAAEFGPLWSSSAYSGWHSGHTAGAFDEGDSCVLLLIRPICILTPLF